MDFAISAARLVVGRALSPVTDGLLESWTASSELGPNVRALKLELLYAKGLLDNARGRDVRSPALGELLLELQHQAYSADDVLDELEYFRIQDELQGTYETTDAEDRGLVGSVVLHARHTSRAVAHKLKCSCSCAAVIRSDSSEDSKKGCFPMGCSSCGGENANEIQEEAERTCFRKMASTARNTAIAVGRRLPCYSVPSVQGDTNTDMPRSSRRPFLCCSWSSKAQHRKCSVHAPKLKFDRVELSRKMVDIVEQLKPVCAKVSTILDMELVGSAIHKLELLGGNGTSIHQSTTLNRPRTSDPLIIQPKFYGRDNLRKELVGAITQGKYSANELTVLSLFGPGGIGKTEFTKHIYQDVNKHFQDQDANKHFQVSIWICVSQNFSASRLLEEIITKIPKGDNENAITGNVEEQIRKRLQLKRFLLVLDDMWTYDENEWKKLLAPFENRGIKGNMVIVTTRRLNVAEHVATKGCFRRLERLNDEDCMHLLKELVFDDQQSWEHHSNLYEVGQNIVKRLKGFPLAVKTVGRILRKRRTVDHWTSVLNSKEWEDQTGDDDIMPALKLSYSYLPFDLQQCFSYCALFPEDYEFGNTELIHLWIGLGLLGASNQNKRVEDIGLDYIDDLVDHGFFQKSEKEDNNPCYMIHDLLHELAVKVSEYECLSIDGSNVKSKQIPASIRHLTIIVDTTDVKDRTTFENFKTNLGVLGKRVKAENLRTLMLFGDEHGSFSKTFSELFDKAKALRVLFLSEVPSNLEDLLPNFPKLVHLRYLRIKGYRYPATTLPSYISRFYHLLVLDLCQSNIRLASVTEMSNLVKIRHFLVQNRDCHSEISEVGKLQSLQELWRFEVKKDISGFELKQLGKLLNLRGSLAACNLERIEETKEADEAKLVDMNYLTRLELKWGTNGSIKDLKKEEDVLEKLKPNSNVEDVCIRGHGGTTYPSWLRDLYITNLVHLCLDGVAWKSLPLLGELWTVHEHGEECRNYIGGQTFQKLKRIELRNIQTLKRWRENGTQSFPVLVELVVENCPELIELPFSHCTSCPAEKEETVTMFPMLREIVICNCPKLSPLPPIPWSDTLCEALMWQAGTSIEQLSYSNKRWSKDVRVEMGKDAHDSELWNMLAFNNLRDIESFRMVKCPPVPLARMQPLESLKRLSIRNCSNVLWPVEGENNSCYKFPIEYLSIWNCVATGKELTQFISYFPNLSELDVDNCKMVTGLGVAEKQITSAPTPSPSASDEKTGDEQIKQLQQQASGADEIESAVEGLLLLPPQIKELRICDCPDLRLFSGSLDEGTASSQRLQGLGSLVSFATFGCPNLLSSCSSSSTYCPFPTSLQYLRLGDVEGLFAFAPLSNLTDLYISNCGDLRGEVLWPLLAHGHLTELAIEGCPNLFGSEPPRLDEQNHPHPYGLQELVTDGKAGILAVPLCAPLSASLTKLEFHWNNDMEHFTKEQEQALQILTSLQELKISFCHKLQGMPAGLSRLPNLKRLEISCCEAIRLWPKDGLPSSLTELVITSCPAIRSLPKGSLPSSLQTLDVHDGDNNEELKRQCHKLRGTIPIIRA